MSNIITSATDLSRILSNSAKENEELLKTYNDEIKPRLKSIINQHSLAGVIIGPLPTMGIATTINLITLYGRLSKVLDIPIMQELDKLIAPAISSTRSAFMASGVGLPVGIIGGALSGWYFSNKSGNIFAKNIADFVKEKTERT